MDNNLFQAILAMDSYNQGYVPDVASVGNSIGTATFLGIPGTQYLIK